MTPPALTALSAQRLYGSEFRFYSSETQRRKGIDSTDEHVFEETLWGSGRFFFFFFFSNHSLRSDTQGTLETALWGPNAGWVSEAPRAPEARAELAVFGLGGQPADFAGRNKRNGDKSNLRLYLEEECVYRNNFCFGK